MAREICQDCGKTFLGGPNSYLCTSCRKGRLRNYAQERKLSELGNKARSEKKNREATAEAALEKEAGNG